MRYFCYNELDMNVDGIILSNRVETVSEEWIRKEYYPHWYKRMCDIFGELKVIADYNFNDCLDNWIAVNWAWEVNKGEQDGTSK